MPRPRSDTKLRPRCTVAPPEPIHFGASASAPLLPALATNVACDHVTFPSSDSQLVASTEPSTSRPNRRVGSLGAVPPSSPFHTCSLASHRYHQSIETRARLLGRTRAPISPPHARASAPRPFVETAARASLLWKPPPKFANRFTCSVSWTSAESFGLTIVLLAEPPPLVPFSASTSQLNVSSRTPGNRCSHGVAITLASTYAPR